MDHRGPSQSQDHGLPERDDGCRNRRPYTATPKGFPMTREDAITVVREAAHYLMQLHLEDHGTSFEYDLSMKLLDAATHLGDGPVPILIENGQTAVPQATIRHGEPVRAVAMVWRASGSNAWVSNCGHYRIHLERGRFRARYFHDPADFTPLVESEFSTGHDAARWCLWHSGG